MSHEFDVVLTISLPTALEEDLLDHLLEHPEWVSGVTTTPAEGYGRDTLLQTTVEQIRGRARRRVITLLIAQAHLDPLLASLRSAFQSQQMAYWVTPLLQFGRFA
jgi:hypothetical protein